MYQVRMVVYESSTMHGHIIMSCLQWYILYGQQQSVRDEKNCGWAAQWLISHHHPSVWVKQGVWLIRLQRRRTTQWIIVAWLSSSAAMFFRGFSSERGNDFHHARVSVWLNDYLPVFFRGWLSELGESAHHVWVSVWLNKRDKGIHHELIDWMEAGLLLSAESLRCPLSQTGPFT